MDMNVYFEPEPLKSHYAITDDFRSRSNDWETLAARPISDWYVEQLRNLEFKEVLDAGCGLGRFSVALARQRDVNITAVDLAPEMVEATRQAVGPLPGTHRFLQGAIESLDLKDGSFDLVLANLLLHHVSDIAGTFKKLADLTRSGGHVALLTADFDWMSELNRFHDRALLELGFEYDHSALTAPGTNRFCDANIHSFVPDSLTLVTKPWFDGTMTFDSVARMHNFYVRTMRYKNVALRMSDDSLQKMVFELMKGHSERNNLSRVSSSLFLYVFRKN
jgi:SAM-dependent methyltransferase